MSRPNRTAHLRIGDPEDDAHALRSGERQIEASDLRPRIPKRRPVPRIKPGEQAPKLLTLDRSGKSELPRAVAQPLAPSLTAPEVVLLGSLANALDHVDPPLGAIKVVLGLAGLQLSDRQQGDVLRSLSRCRTSVAHL